MWAGPEGIPTRASTWRAPAGPAGGTLVAGGNARAGGVSGGGNNSGVLNSGPPAAVTTPVGKQISFNSSGDLSQQSSMTPNNSPTTATKLWNIPMSAGPRVSSNRSSKGVPLSTPRRGVIYLRNQQPRP